MNCFKQGDLIDWVGKVIPYVPASPMSPESLLIPSSSTASPEPPATPMFLPSLPLPPPVLKPASSLALYPLVPVSPSTHPQSAPSGRSDPPRSFLSLL